jgi:threonine/homoserine/homoserine lactone efflux protein
MSGHFADAPETWRSLATLVLSALVIMGSPGPSTISATAMGAAFGIRRSLQYVAGLIAGTIAVLLMVSAGAVVLLLAVPHGAVVLSVVSAGYILYLALKIATASPLSEQGTQTSAPSFASGLLLAIANPKAYLAIAAVFAGTTVDTHSRHFDALIKIVVLSLMIVTIHVVWLMAGVWLARLLRDPVSSRLVNLALAVLLVVTTAIALVGQLRG